MNYYLKITHTAVRSRCMIMEVTDEGLRLVRDNDDALSPECYDTWTWEEMSHQIDLCGNPNSVKLWSKMRDFEFLTAEDLFLEAL